MLPVDVRRSRCASTSPCTRSEADRTFARSPGARMSSPSGPGAPRQFPDLGTFSGRRPRSAPGSRGPLHAGTGAAAGRRRPTLLAGNAARRQDDERRTIHPQAARGLGDRGHRPRRWRWRGRGRRSCRGPCRRRACAGRRRRRRRRRRPCPRARRGGRSGCGSRRGGRGRRTPPWRGARRRRRRPRCGRSRRPAASRGRPRAAPASTLVRAPAANSGRHPVEEGAVVVGAGQRAHLRPHRGEHQAHAGEPLAQLGQRLAHPGQRLLREAGADAEPEPRRVEPEPLDVGGDLLRRGAVERDHGDAEVERRAPPRRTRPASRAPWRPGGRWTTSSRSRARRSAPRAAAATSGSSPAATPKPRLMRPSPSSATHSMCGVCGNMSTGLTRRSL